MNLRLLQLGDSALPIGGYSHSWGMEAAIEQGVVKDAPTLEEWVRSWLTFAIGPCEGIVIAVVCRATSENNWSDVTQSNELLNASLTPPTLRHASIALGEQLLALSENWPWAGPEINFLRDLDQSEWHHAPVFATLAAKAGATANEAVAVYLHQAVLGAIGAGVRAIPLGHTHGQQILARLHDEIDRLADEFSQRTLAAAGSFCPAYEIQCHAQSQLYTRLFRS